MEAVGSTRIDGDINAEEMTVSGTTRIDGKTTGGILDATGATRLADVSVDSVEMSSELSGGGIEAVILVVQGAIRADTINATLIDFAVESQSEIGRIEAEHVTVTPEEKDGYFVADRIVAGTVSLGASKVEGVVVDTVTLGSDAAIGTVRTDEIDAHDDTAIDTIE